MKDAYERRALLLHLGDVLETVNRLMACGADRQTVNEAVAANDSLKGLPLLTHVSPSMNSRDFIGQVAAGFVAWPKALLELELDREQLARTVRQALFAGNVQGWQDYVATLRESVAWFGTGQEPLEASEVAEAATSSDAEQPEPLARDAQMARAGAGDIERESGDPSSASRESVENDERLYPSWPWKSGV